MSYIVGIIEDNEQYAETVIAKLKKIDSIEKIIHWKSAEEAWRDNSLQELDFAFIDIQLVHMDGVELTGMIHEKYPNIKIVMLTNVNSEKTIFKAIESGAMGYVFKSDLNDVANVFSIVIKGGAIISPTIAFYVMKKLKKEPSEKTNLTTREKQILDLLVTGLDPKKIAGTIGISVETMRTHVKNIYKKLNVSNKIQLMRKASELGFFDS